MYKQDAFYFCYPYLISQVCSKIFNTKLVTDTEDETRTCYIQNELGINIHSPSVMYHLQMNVGYRKLGTQEALTPSHATW